MSNKQLNEKLLDKTLDLMIESVISEAEDKIVEDILRDIDINEDVVFSDEHKKRMQKIFDIEQRKLRFNKLYYYSKRIAVVLLILIVVFGISLVSVEAWRVKVLNFIIEISDDSTGLAVVGNENENKSELSEYEFLLEYIPKGLELEYQAIDSEFITIQYASDEYYFNFSVSSANKMRIDTENAAIHQLTINGRKAFYSTNDNVNILVWYDDNFIYDVTGTISKEDIIKIAENLNTKN